MENQIVRRRTKIIAAHLACQEDISASATHVFPMSCSNSLNSVIRRYDNRTNFARQGSASQGCYMRPALNEQGNHVQPVTPSKSGNSGEKRSDSLDDAPAFSRPVRVEPGIPTLKGVQPVDQGCRYTNSALEAPVFARPTKECGQALLRPEENARNSAQTGSVWSPRMDVVESGLSYLLTVEIPGVSIDDVKVEVDDQSLIVSGKRLNWSCEAPRSNKPAMSYHRREILQGPYRIVWPLPSNTRKDGVSAEIQDGLLHVTIPKLSGLRWLRKAYM